MLLDGSSQGDLTSERIVVALSAQLEVRGWDVEPVLLRERKIGNCAGDFYCWIRSPGMCNVNDDNRVIAEGIVASDLVVYLTPVTFGGYSSDLKRMLDHQIQNVSPFFTTIEGEIHHKARYASNPDLLAVGWMDGPDERAAAVFRHLVQRNALNLHARTSVAAVVTADLTDRDLQAAAKGWLGDIEEAARHPQRGCPNPMPTWARLPRSDVRSCWWVALGPARALRTCSAAISTSSSRLGPSRSRRCTHTRSCAPPPRPRRCSMPWRTRTW
jgi:multimeric flavodoxin WrbA